MATSDLDAGASEESAVYEEQIDALDGDRARKVSLTLDGAALAYIDVLRLWRTDGPFRAFFIDLLAAAPLSAFRWETPPITRATAGRPFEFVLLDCPSLERPADEYAFAEHFGDAGEDRIATFPNLGRDALLVVPCPDGAASAYAHLGVFARDGPPGQNHALWIEVGRAMNERLGARPVWLNTAGMGISWVHVRLDDRPKYYGHAPYRAPPPA